MDVETCDHPACSCAVTNGKHFCSHYCETASKDVEHNDTCECGHSQCDRLAYRPAAGPTRLADPAAPALGRSRRPTPS